MLGAAQGNGVRVQHKDGEDFYPPALQQWLTAFFLLVVNWVAVLDRQVIALLSPMIKADLHLTDFQLSLVMSSFALLLCATALPAGWAIDRFSRRMVLFSGMMIWSLATIVGGFTRSFGQLFASRALVGAGEATVNPSAYSILADTFPPGRLSSALSLMTLGGSLGNGMAFLLGGILIALAQGAGTVSIAGFGSFSPWQQVLVLVGLPGLVVAWFTFFVPKQRNAHATAEDFARHAGSRVALAYGRRHTRFLIAHWLGFGLVSGALIGLMTWNPTFLTRTHHWSIERAALWLGLIQTIIPLLGVVLHGMAVDALFRRGFKDAHFRYFMWMSLLAVPSAIAAYAVPSGEWAVIFFGLFYACIMSYAAIAPAALQIATPRALRGRFSAMYVIIGSLVGAAGGPMLIAAITDFGFGTEAGIGPSMAIVGGGSLLAAAALFAWGLAPMRRAIAEAENLNALRADPASPGLAPELIAQP